MSAQIHATTVKQLREQFELAYAIAWAADRQRTDSVEFLANQVKTWREGDTYPEDLPRLRFGWEVFPWAALKGRCGLNDQDAELLEQGASMLEALSVDERSRGNDSAASGAECSAHAVRRLAAALLAPRIGPAGELLAIAAEQRHDELRGFNYGPAEIAGACEIAAWHLNQSATGADGQASKSVEVPFPLDPTLKGYRV